MNTHKIYCSDGSPYASVWVQGEVLCLQVEKSTNKMVVVLDKNAIPQLVDILHTYIPKPEVPVQPTPAAPISVQPAEQPPPAKWWMKFLPSR